MTIATETKPDTFTLYVPKTGTFLRRTLAAGSAIVSNADPARHEGLADGMIIIHYEGNVYDAENLRTYPERVLSAAGRLRERYPTSAMQGAYLKDLIVIGSFHYPTRGLLIEDRGALQAWLGAKNREDQRFVKRDSGDRTSLSQDDSKAVSRLSPRS